MTLRDLTTKQLERLQKRCQDEFNQWARNRAVTDLVEAAWKQAWSNALKIRLDLTESE